MLKHFDFSKNQGITSNYDVLNEVKQIQSALEKKNYAVNLLGLTDDYLNEFNLIKSLDQSIVFNLCDTISSETHLAPLLPMFLQKNKINFIGANTEGLKIAQNKIKVKELLFENNLPTPKYQTINHVKELANFQMTLTPPVILKLACEHASLGITNESVCTNEKEVLDFATTLLKNFDQPILIEEFITGSEFYVSLYGHPPKATKTMSVEFESNFPVGLQFKTYESKWANNSKDLKGAFRKGISFIERDSQFKSIYNLNNIEMISKKAFQIAGCRDWGRVEFRVDKSEVPMIIDVTPNTYMGETGLCWKAAQASGFKEYGDFLDAIIKGALERN